MRVVPNSLLPARVSNFVLSPNVPLSEAFRAEMQAWLDDFFGTHAVAYVFDPLAVGFGFVGKKIIAAHPENIAALRLHFEAPGR